MLRVKSGCQVILHEPCRYLLPARCQSLFSWLSSPPEPETRGSTLPSYAPGRQARLFPHGDGKTLHSLWLEARIRTDKVRDIRDEHSSRNSRQKLLSTCRLLPLSTRRRGTLHIWRGIHPSIQTETHHRIHRSSMGSRKASHIPSTLARGGSCSRLLLSIQ